jgi:hypothetical protein
MKIKKLITESALAKEIEALEEAAEDETTVDEIPEEDIIVDDIVGASVSEIADTVQSAKEVESDGKETYSDKAAEKLATELKTAAKGLDNAKWAPLDVPSAITDILDECLAAAMVAQKSGRRDGVDLLINGLPGSGKTGIVKQWAKDRDVNLFELDSNDDELGALLKGFPIDTVRKDADGNDEHAVIKSFSSALDSLKNPRSVLFLDEFNRAPQSLRANLLKLINSHEVPGPGKNGRRRFDNLLFTIACINPVVDSDTGVVPLNDAEKSRFAVKKKWDSQVDTAIRYLNFYISKTIDNLDPTDDDYAFLYIRHKKTYNLAMALLTDPRFEFDSRQDLTDLDDDEMSMLNQRSITDGLLFAGYSKDRFLRWVDEDSGYLQKNITMIHDILDSWVEPKVDAPTSGTAAKSASNNTTNDFDDATQQAAATDEGDFDSIFGDSGVETDDDLFGAAASSAGHAAKVSAADALNRIKGFDFSL